MKKVLLSALIASCLFSCESNVGVQHETVKNDLRAPAYPLITIDPYTSAWSAADNLYDASVTHWTGKDFPLIGVLKVDGEPYRFMGTENIEMNTVVPTSTNTPWNGRYTNTKPQGDWTAENYDDSKWQEGPAAFGTMESEPLAKTQWGTKNIWVRRTVDITEDLGDRPVYLDFSHDDDAVFYINGVKAFSIEGYGKNKVAEISPEARAALRPGKNVMAAECVSPQGGSFLDFGLIVPQGLEKHLEKTAVQTSADVQATQTHYTFTCGPVDLALTFTAPLLLEDPELVSRPVNYVTYTVTSNDGKKHDVEIYFEASPLWALDMPYQQSASEAYEKNGMAYLKAGSTEQPVLGKKGDDLRIDWGYFYMAAPASEEVTYGIGSGETLRSNFVNGESIAVATAGGRKDGNMALVCDYGEVKNVTGKIMIGYDDVYSIQYFGENLRPYWNRKGDKTIESQFEAADSQYDELMERCYAFDKQLMDDATAAGGKKYADLCALAYRQAIAAHKLVESPRGELLWLSKENNSNGSIGTVDVTYPSAPLFLYYNPEFAKGLLNHIFDYAENGDWKKPYPAHDVGTYPLANGQTYGGDMPVEEGGNMLILTAAICDKENSPEYAKKHWDVLTTWTDYLTEKGLDPENQLCTDDFAGHFAHNANLSIKAILGIASYAKLAKMQGMDDVAEKYFTIARNYAKDWEKMANAGDHYKLTFDKDDTWSQKYNIVWDELLDLNVFPENIVPTEVDYYLTKQNQYGLPLDNRKTYTKSDWIIWTASLADSPEKFEAFVEPMYKFYGETVDRIPMTDWYYTDTPNHVAFIARSVVGGYFMKMLSESKKAEKQN
ncbi:MAG: DUF4965 domain-containing protein [Muribaculaceae bacterium]|nr:DUF4965 domain-containing protein [Muribaculaceae bacterium]